MKVGGVFSSSNAAASDCKGGVMPATREDFHGQLERQFRKAESEGATHIELTAGFLHRCVGDYPNPKTHRMPMCCDAMRRAMQPGDEELYAPPKGKGASLKIRYLLPRQR